MPERELLVTGGEALVIVIVIGLALAGWAGALWLDRREADREASERALRRECRRHHPTRYDGFWGDR